MKTVFHLALAFLLSAVLFAVLVPVFGQEAPKGKKGDEPVAAKEDKGIPLPNDKAKALEDVKVAFEKAQKDAELAQARLDAAKAQMEKAQLQFVLIVEATKKEVKCDDCQLSEDGKSLKKPQPPEKTAKQ